MKIKNLFLILTIPVIFFLFAFATLKDYGVNWDEPVHFIRGQAYLTYFLTGKTSYQKLSSTPSYFQNESLNAQYWLKEDSGHPPLNGILAALSNLIFYQKLHILGDIDSYHLFNITASFVMVLMVSAFAYEAYGGVPAIISGLALSTYPLFFSESHFNIKDPPEAAFFAATIFFIWMSLKKFNWKWLLLAAVSFAVSFSIKFDILFLPFVVLPYLFIRYFGKFKEIFLKIPKSYYLGILIAPVLVAAIFVGSWPYLWANPLNNFLKIVFYYKSIGTGGVDFPGYIFKGLDLYPIFWIIVTTPIYVLFLCVLGIIYSILSWKKDKEKTGLLWLFWFLMPIVRVTVPGSVVYGGVRQIFEYIPAMALLTGLGAQMVLNLFKPVYRKSLIIVLVLLFIPQVIALINIHPNENVYFNELIGGLSGAAERNVPSWGNSYGNAYWQAIKWLDKNAPKNSRLALVNGTGQNIPLVELRSDIDFSNGYWSGIFRNGEYLVELTFNSGINPYPYAWEYVNKVLKPVYEVKADGVSIAKVWKNDLEHTNPDYQKPETRLWNFSLNKLPGVLEANFDKSVVLTRFFLHYAPNTTCSGVAGTIETSMDGKTWKPELETTPNIQVSVKDLQKNTSPFFFAARNLRYLKIVTDKKSCLLNITAMEVWGL